MIVESVEGGGGGGDKGDQETFVCIDGLADG